MKHYINVNTSNYIIKGFSDAFIQSTEMDICINEQGGRHFELLGQVNPPLVAMTGAHLYKYVDGIVLKTTEEERVAEIEQTQLPTMKSAKVAESKVLLEEYFADNPYLFVDGKYYTVTKDKQILLSNALMVCQAKALAGDTNPMCKWSATGEICVEWSMENLMALSLSIAAYVEPLISKQQTYEIQINACTSKVDLDKVVIDYATTT